MLSRIYIQCFENNKGAEKDEVNYERLKNPKKKCFGHKSQTGPIRVRFDSLLTDTHDQLKNLKLIVNYFGILRIIIQKTDHIIR
jgi:hypothetical protein